MSVNFYQNIPQMNLISWKGVFAAFKLVCLTSAISMTIYCSYEYSKNDDLSVVEFKEFNENTESVYPQIELCVMDFSPESEVAKESGFEIDPRSFEETYRGDDWNEQVLNIDMNKVKQKIHGNVLDTFLSSKLHARLGVARHSDGNGTVSTYINVVGQKCIVFHYQTPKTIWEANIWIKTSIFPNGTRPTSGQFVARFTFPEQSLYYGSHYKFQWPIQENPSNPFVMYFILSGIEVIRYRNKRASPCVDWKNHDLLIMKNTMSTVGCRPFYWEVTDLYRNCTTQEDMKKIYQTILKVFFEKAFIPCSTVQKMQMDFDEEESDVNKEAKKYSGIERRLGGLASWFRVTITFSESYYKNIRQVRAYNVQSLIGNAGGYVGLFVGYTIAELPVLLLTIYQKLKTSFSSLTLTQTRIVRKRNDYSNSWAEHTTFEGTGQGTPKLEQRVDALERQMKSIECQINRTEK